VRRVDRRLSAQRQPRYTRRPQLVLTGAVAKDPGTYDPQAWCGKGATSDPDVDVTVGNLTAVAAAV
jgi:hypothetical protein